MYYLTQIAACGRPAPTGIKASSYWGLLILSETHVDIVWTLFVAYLGRLSRDDGLLQSGWYGRWNDDRCLKKKNLRNFKQNSRKTSEHEHFYITFKMTLNIISVKHIISFTCGFYYTKWSSEKKTVLWINKCYFTKKLSTLRSLNYWSLIYSSLRHHHDLQFSSWFLIHSSRVLEGSWIHQRFLASWKGSPWTRMWSDVRYVFYVGALLFK